MRILWRRYALDLEEQVGYVTEDRDRLSQLNLRKDERILRLKADNDRLRHRMGILHPDEDVEYDTRPYRPYLAGGEIPAGRSYVVPFDGSEAT